MQMIFSETKLKGAYIIEIEKREDNRGFFARTWCQREFVLHNLNPCVVQSNTSFNIRKGTLRGLHYQAAPHAETKLIRCVKGSIYDVIVDLRPDSPAYTQYISAELTAENYRMLYVPAYFAHGFMTLKDNTEVVYQVSEFYSPESERGIRWNDPSFQIKWPSAVKVISDKDASWSDYILQKTGENK